MKYLSIVLSKRGIVGTCLWDQTTKKVRITSCGKVGLSNFLEKIVEKWQPNKIIANKEVQKYNDKFINFISLTKTRMLTEMQGLGGLEKKNNRYFYYGEKLGNVEQRCSIVMLYYYLKDVEKLNLEVNKADKGLEAIPNEKVCLIANDTLRVELDIKKKDKTFKKIKKNLKVVIKLLLKIEQIIEKE